ncbi:MAG: hypothetical protein GX613_13145 [Chloroflexi bacterium]|nr:hypothetical protein [Chloroflexota bacterium]
MSDSELIITLLTIAFSATLIGAVIARRVPIRLRPIAAYDALPEIAANAVESAHRVHFSLGSSSLGESSTASALATSEAVYQLADRLAISPYPPLITLSQPTTLPLAQDTLRRAYERRLRAEAFRATQAAWYPLGKRSLAFAAGASAHAADVDAYSSVLLGRFGTELAFFGEGAVRHDQVLVAHSDNPGGQAVAYVQSDYPLLGEELYAGPAYLSHRPLHLGSVVAMDVLRWAVIMAILFTALQAAL